MSLPFRRKEQQQQQVPRKVLASSTNNSMYSAFLLDHGDQLRYRLLTGADGDEADAMMNASKKNEEGGDTNSPAAAESSQQENEEEAVGPPRGRIPVIGIVENDQKDEDGKRQQQAATGDTVMQVSAVTAAAATCMQMGGGWIKLTRRNIHILNITAAVVHAILFIIIYSQAAGKGKQAWRLKQDRVQVVTKSVGDSNPFVKITNEKCNIAKPNSMDYGNSPMGSVQLWTYPQDSGIDVDLAWCVILFFALSFVFQMGVSVYSVVWKKGYYTIFHNDASQKDTNVDTMQSKAFLDSNPSQPEVALWCSDILAFNWARFVEYTFSGSLVLFTIALIAGIADFELLLCIYTLSAACMLMGLGAEYCMRNYFSLKMMAASPNGGLPDYAKKLIVDTICPQLRLAFFVLHAFAWVCILVPWYIIYVHYRGWWEQCTTPDAKGVTVKPEPPDFVKAIIFMQAILFLLFGAVQLVQFFYPHKRRVVEVTYIGLSLTAKVLLGGILAANVLLA